MAESMTTEITLATALIDTLETDRDVITTLPRRNTVTNIRVLLGQPNATHTTDQLKRKNPDVTARTVFDTYTCSPRID
jgi:hypothetical protein